MTKKEIIILILIILLAATLRLVFLDSIPSGFNHDEALSGYEAYSILETAKDQHGNFLPWHFKAFGDFVPPVFFYLTVPSVAIFGLSEFAVRFVAAFFGILTIYFTFRLTQLLFRNNKLALLAAFFIAIVPWHLHFSRIGWPASILPFFLAAGTYFFIKGIEKKNAWSFLGAALLGLGPSVYSTAKVFVPLFFLSLVIIYRKEIKAGIKYSVPAIIIFVLVVSPVYIATLMHPDDVQARFNNISIFNAESPVYVVMNFVSNYMSQLSFDFLFLNGDSYPHQSVPGFGELYLFEFPFIIMALYVLAKNIRKKNSQLLLAWLILYPVAASLTVSGIPHAIRGNVALPAICIISALGAYTIWEKVKGVRFFKLYLVPLYIGLSLVFVAWYMYAYFWQYPKDYAIYFRYGYSEMFDRIENIEEDYKEIHISHYREQPYIMLLFYHKYDPEYFQKAKKEVSQYSESVVVMEKFDKYRFHNEIHPDIVKEGNLYVVPEDELENYSPIETIKYPNGGIAFKIIDPANEDK